MATNSTAQQELREISSYPKNRRPPCCQDKDLFNKPKMKKIRRYSSVTVPTPNIPQVDGPSHLLLTAPITEISEVPFDKEDPLRHSSNQAACSSSQCDEYRPEDNSISGKQEIFCAHEASTSEDILYGFSMREFFNLPSVPAEDSELSLSGLKQRPLMEDKKLKHIMDAISVLDFMEKTAFFHRLMCLNIGNDNFMSHQNSKNFLVTDAERTSQFKDKMERLSVPRNVYDAVHLLLFSFIHCCYVGRWIRDQPAGHSMRKMNDSWENYMAALEGILHFYTREQNADTVSDINFAEVQRAVEKMKEFPAYTTPKWQKDISPDHILCWVLGIGGECADWMEKIPDDLRSHQTDQYWIECYLERKAEEMEDIMTDKYTGDGEPWKTYFMELGFTKYRATYLADKFVNTSKIYGEHQTPLYWAKVYIENTFTYDMLLNNMPRYPYCPDILNKWIRYDIESGEVVDEEDKPEGAECRKKILRFINHVKERRKDASYSSCDGTKYPPESDEEHLILFHGTTHKSAKSLTEKGIILAKGKEGQDFSDEERMGFYLSHDFETAKLWASQKGHGHGAVVVYKIPKDLFSHFQDDYLDLHADRKKWREIVKHCRTGKYPLSKQTRNEYRKAAYVEGPICLNGSKVNKEEPTGFGRGELQTCILSEEMSKSVGDLSKIDGVVFL